MNCQLPGDVLNISAKRKNRLSPLYHVPAIFEAVIVELTSKDNFPCRHGWRLYGRFIWSHADSVCMRHSCRRGG